MIKSLFARKPIAELLAEGENPQGLKRVLGPGDLIIIPKGAAHAGSVATSGEFKALAIKLPPQAAGDTHLLP